MKNDFLAYLSAAFPASTQETVPALLSLNSTDSVFLDEVIGAYNSAVLALPNIPQIQGFKLGRDELYAPAKLLGNFVSLLALTDDTFTYSPVQCLSIFSGFSHLINRAHIVYGFSPAGGVKHQFGEFFSEVFFPKRPVNLLGMGLACRFLALLNKIQIDEQRYFLALSQLPSFSKPLNFSDKTVLDQVKKHFRYQGQSFFSTGFIKAISSAFIAYFSELYGSGFRLLSGFVVSEESRLDLMRCFAILEEIQGKTNEVESSTLSWLRFLTQAKEMEYTITRNRPDIPIASDANLRNWGDFGEQLAALEEMLLVPVTCQTLTLSECEVSRSPLVALYKMIGLIKNLLLDARKGSAIELQSLIEYAKVLKGLLFESGIYSFIGSEQTAIKMLFQGTQVDESLSISVLKAISLLLDFCSRNVAEFFQRLGMPELQGVLLFSEYKNETNFDPFDGRLHEQVRALFLSAVNRRSFELICLVMKRLEFVSRLSKDDKAEWIRRVEQGVQHDDYHEVLRLTESYQEQIENERRVLLEYASYAGVIENLLRDINELDRYQSILGFSLSCLFLMKKECESYIEEYHLLVSSLGEYEGRLSAMQFSLRQRCQASVSPVAKVLNEVASSSAVSATLVQPERQETSQVILHQRRLQYYRKLLDKMIRHFFSVRTIQELLIKKSFGGESLCVRIFLEENDKENKIFNYEGIMFVFPNMLEISGNFFSSLDLISYFLEQDVPLLPLDKKTQSAWYDGDSLKNRMLALLKSYVRSDTFLSRLFAQASRHHVQEIQKIIEKYNQDLRPDAHFNLLGDLLAIRLVNTKGTLSEYIQFILMKMHACCSFEKLQPFIDKYIAQMQPAYLHVMRAAPQ